MRYNEAHEVLEALVQAYYYERDIEETLSCVTEDIEWVGTENNDSAHGKEELRTLLKADVEAFPSSFGVDLNDPIEQKYGRDVVMFTVTGEQVAVPGVVAGFTIRGTVCCVKTENGWLISNVHTSVPNSEIEKFSLERELSAVRKKEKALMESIPGGVAIYRLKKDGRIVADYISKSLSRMCGYESDEVTELIDKDLMHNVVKEDVETLNTTIKSCIDSNMPIHATYRITTKQGDQVLNQLNANVIPDSDLQEDDIAVAYAVHTIVTDADKKIISERICYRNILDMLDIAFFEATGHENVYLSEKYNNYAISDTDIKKMFSNGCDTRYVHPDDIPILVKFLDGIKNPTGRNATTLRLKMKDGSYRWTEIMGFTHYENNEEKTGKRITGIFRDIDNSWIEQKQQLQQALEDAQAANNAKTAFLSRVSHDMRTPLNGILGLTALLKNRISDVEINRDLYELELSGKYLLNLINDTLDMSRIESGKMELHPIVCDGKNLFNTALRLAKSGMQKKHINFHVYADDFPSVILYVDAERIEQIVMNVLSNATKFTPESGNVDVTITNTFIENEIIINKLVISDNGIGISPEFLPYIFDAFSQEDSSRTSSNQGTGLGMAITKQLINLMGGDISVTSEVGKGSSFTLIFKLPIATEEQIAKWKKSHLAADIVYNLSGKRILLCEDHPLNAKIAIKLLETRGMIVEHAENGRIGVDMFKHSAPGYYDGILMDIRMPVLDGLAATEEIRSLPRRDARLIPIIAMTANAFQNDIEQTKNAGMDAHLSKPIQPYLLYQTLAQFLEIDHNVRKQKVLVVDDLEINRDIIKTTLEEDYDILEAENGHQALEILSNTKGLDIVITDIQMPQMDGIELIKQIRSNKKYSHVVIIANTQFGDPGQEEKLLELGANDFIYKPTTPKIVAIRVRNAQNKI